MEECSRLCFDMSLFILMHFSFGVPVGGLANAHFSPCNLSTNLVKMMSFRIAVINFRDFSYELSDLKKKYTHKKRRHTFFSSTLKLVFLSILVFLQSPSFFHYTQASLPCHGLKLFSVCMGIAGSSLTATQMSWILPAALPASVSPEGARAYLQTHSLV